MGRDTSKLEDLQSIAHVELSAECVKTSGSLLVQFLHLYSSSSSLFLLCVLFCPFIQCAVEPLEAISLSACIHNFMLAALYVGCFNAALLHPRRALAVVQPKIK